MSDEEAQEVVHLLSPSVESLDKPNDSQWVNEMLTALDTDEISLQRYTFLKVRREKLMIRKYNSLERRNNKNYDILQKCHSK